MNRSNIKKIRPDIPSIKDHKPTNDIEKFQSKVLRPIAKYQNEIILQTFHAHLKKYKLKLEGKSAHDVEAMITKIIKTDKQLKTFYQGLISALMTEEEFEFYFENQSEVNKRIGSLIEQRIISQITDT